MLNLWSGLIVLESGDICDLYFLAFAIGSATLSPSRVIQNRINFVVGVLRLPIQGRTEFTHSRRFNYLVTYRTGYEFAFSVLVALLNDLMIFI